jgi:hypothetical protein
VLDAFPSRHVLSGVDKSPVGEKHSNPPVIKVKASLCLTEHYAMKTYGGVDV